MKHNTFKAALSHQNDLEIPILVIFWRNPYKSALFSVF